MKPRPEEREIVCVQPATAPDADELAALHTSVAEDLTRRHGRGPWTTRTSAKGVLLALRTSSVFVARDADRIVATWRLTTKKPWAIDTKYFTKVERPLYLLAMAVLPDSQRQGWGRQCLVAVERVAREWPADAVRLDAYDAAAGGGPFYARSGYDEVGRASYRNTALIYYERLLH